MVLKSVSVRIDLTGVIFVENRNTPCTRSSHDLVCAQVTVTKDSGVLKCASVRLN